jgi:hypothetical protein
MVGAPLYSAVPVQNARLLIGRMEYLHSDLSFSSQVRRSVGSCLVHGKVNGQAEGKMIAADE